MRDIFTVTEVKWHISLEDIREIRSNIFRYTIILNDGTTQDIPKDIFELFKQEFPELCIDIQTMDELDIPF